MYSLRVTAQDGSVRNYPLSGAPLGVGRDGTNAIVIDGVGVSSFHCTVEMNASGVFLTDRGSRNGTWISGKRVEAPVRLGEDDRVYVGPFLLQIERLVENASVPVELNTTGPIVRSSGPHRKWRDMQAKLQRYADQWDAADRPARLLLAGDELRQAKRWLASPPPSPVDEPGRVVRELIAASTKADSRRGVTTIVLAIAGVLVLAGGATAAYLFWPRDPTPEPVAQTEPTQSESSGGEEDDGEDDGPPIDPQPRRTTPPKPTEDDAAAGLGPIEHVVVPGERLSDIAKRYGVDEDDIVEWNLISRDKPLEPSKCTPPSEERPAADAEKPKPTGQVLRIEKPRLRPLPQTCILYEAEAGEGFAQIAARFGLEITRLREYNPGVTDIAPGQKVIVWIDPKPYKPREPRSAIVELNATDAAKSVGTPNAGKLVSGIQLPENDAYTRKAPNIMWGSAYLIKNLHKAIVTFRQDVDYDGALIVADISKKTGGHFDPHKSHQAGRDVDIWLPTLKGVYKTKHLGSGKEKERRPFWYEVDWYATWGLMRALIKTGAVEAIFLDRILQPYVHNAAKNMGATPEELKAWIQWPDKYNNGKVFVQHSADHYSHIHVRFKCGPQETECKGDRGAPGD